MWEKRDEKLATEKQGGLSVHHQRKKGRRGPENGVSNNRTAVPAAYPKRGVGKEQKKPLIEEVIKKECR